MFRCDKFIKLSIQERAATLEKFGCCPKCTSWNHKKKNVLSGAKCGKLVDGKKCGGEHSSLVCGSGSAYCGSAKVSKFSKLSSSDSSSISSSDSEASLSSDEDNFSSNLDSINAATSRCDGSWGLRCKVLLGQWQQSSSDYT